MENEMACMGKLWIVLPLIFLVLPGCLDQAAKEDKEFMLPNPQSVAALNASLQTDVADYEGTYQVEIYTTQGGCYKSGSRDENNKSVVSVKVSSGNVTNYSMEDEHVLQEYNAENWTLCTWQVTGGADCNRPQEPWELLPQWKIELYFPIPNATAEACPSADREYGGIAGNRPLCKTSNGSESRPEDSAHLFRNISTAGLVFKKDIGTKWSYYRPENKTGMCLLDAKNPSTNESWVVKCGSENFDGMEPNVSVDTDISVLKNVTCEASDRVCICIFDTVAMKPKVCMLSSEPPSPDAQMKTQILLFLAAKQIDAFEVKADSAYGTCYSRFRDGMVQKFCFEDSLLTYASFGHNLCGDYEQNFYNRISKTTRNNWP
ncbi:MAG: hypothetical protein PHS02_01955 [Candidatus ainarchaeum sp.]|nr:hypothetical protein [Candidatus ainarchaeum sp.]